MAKYSDEELLKLIRHLRKKSGIKPIPYSEAELQSGVFSSFAAAMAPPTPVPPPRRQPPIIPRRQLQQSAPKQPLPDIAPPQESQIANGIGTKPLNHRRSFSLKC